MCQHFDRTPCAQARLASPSRLRVDRGTWGSERGHALVAIEHRAIGRRKVHDVQRTGIWSSVTDLDWWIADGGIVPDDVLSDGGRDVDAVRVPTQLVELNNVARGIADDANPKIVWRVRVSVTVSVVQPDPAVMSDHSYAAAR